MFTLLRKKLQSLNETQQNIITIILILFNIAIFIFWVNFWVSLPRTALPVEKQPIPITEPFQSGEIGEITEEEVEEKGISPLPLVIFNTTGVISGLKNDRLIVQGDGSNFSDKKLRELTLIFNDSTIVFEPGQKIKYQGLEGLKYLKTGESISISSPENIRGKTQFIVDYINKL